VHQADQSAAKRGVHRDHGRPGRIFPLVAADAESAAKIKPARKMERARETISLVFVFE